MKAKNIILILSALFSTLLFSIGYDSGMIQWTQPDGTTFTARAWGDEFQGWMETGTGYRIVKNYTDGYYYYAILDANGEFAPSTAKVGIHPPLSDAYQLQRSAARQAEIEAAIPGFEKDQGTSSTLSERLRSIRSRYGSMAI
jgi:hypothetical protein